MRILRDRAQDPKAVASLLILKNADLNVIDEVAAATRANPTTYYLYAAVLGWRPGRTAFVPPNGEAIGPETDIRLLPPLWRSEHRTVTLGQAGNLEEWKRRVAKPSQYSQAAMLVLSAAFAAPLLEVSGLQSFGINLYGKAKVGKTAALLVGASVAGIGRESQLPNWAATTNATSEHARLFSDTMLPANEVGLLAGKRKDAYGHIRELIYRLSEGRDKARHSSYQVTSIGSDPRFRTIFVSTAEHSFDDYAAFAGEKRDEGEYARCIDVPATHPDRLTIMTSRPARIKDDNAKLWARRRVIKLRKACEEQHGTALRPYIEHLIGRGEELASDVRRHQRDFMREMPDRVEGAVEHAARNISLVYAGGRIAIEAGILPWDPKRLLDAVVSCFESALGEIEHHQKAEERAIRTLKIRLREASLGSRGALKKKAAHGYDGFYRDTAEGRLLTIHSTVFGGWFGNRREVRLILDWLDDKGFLRPKSTEKELDRTNIDWAEQTPKWPQGKSVRSIVLLDPWPSKISG